MCLHGFFCPYFGNMTRPPELEYFCIVLYKIGKNSDHIHVIQSNKTKNKIFGSLTIGLKIRVCTGKLFSLFLIQKYVVGTQKKRLNETVLFSTQNECLKDLGQFPIQSAQILTACD